ncbi:MAG: single-stranded-DNA-specific exonuclease RecJ [Candidatus Levybacteria bacterium]|nr:single-stranded-DNA-specific exonuclease RecJ [Candidatus Levybacteria bacterium]
MKKWEILGKFKIKNLELRIADLVGVLLENRGLKTKKEITAFLDPKLEDITVGSVGIDKKQLSKALKRIKKATDEREQIVIFGDYDVDGITGSAILWETLYHDAGANVIPYIPHRVDEGYGLSIRGIENLLSAKVGPLSRSDLNKTKLIITVDNGIVANEAVDFANKQGIDVIITDHHTPSETLPDAFAIVHATKLCGAGVAYLLSQEIKNQKSKIKNSDDDKHLELVALGTVADLVPLVGANRTLVKFGLEKLCRTKRPGIVELFKEAVCDQASAGVYQIGHIIAPRLNASGRMTSAMDSLRLLCTRDQKRAAALAVKLGTTNRERQMVMLNATEHASLSVKAKKALKKMLVVSHDSYPEGVIGLVAGRLVEEYYRPSIVIARGEKVSKGSVRSVSGFNVIEFLRSLSDYFVNVGGHPMAAGFTIETEKIEALQEKIEELAESMVDDEMLTRTLRIDCELPLSAISQELYDSLQKLSPFGMGNPEPTFVSYGVSVEDVRYIGKDGKHLKLLVSQHNPTPRHSGDPLRQLADGGDSRISKSESDSGRALLRQNSGSLARLTLGRFEAIAFGIGDRANEVKPGSTIDVVYTIDENVWNGNKKLQLKVKDFKALGGN